MRGNGKQSNPNILLTPEQKIVFIERGLEYTYKVDWSLYDTLLLRGGEVFNDYPSEIIPSYNLFIERIIELIKNNTIKKLFIITSLKYDYDTSLLKWTLDKLKESGINLHEKVLIGTSWDKKYRFTEKSKKQWNSAIEILESEDIPFHITSILTQSFIDGFNSNDPEILKIMKYSFDFIPAQGKPELLFLDGFFPKRNDCIKFLMKLKNSNKYLGIWVRLLHQNFRRAESIYFTEHDNLQIRDLETFKSVLINDQQEVASCGHPQEYTNYVDSDKCFLCDINMVKDI